MNRCYFRLRREIGMSNIRRHTYDLKRNRMCNFEYNSEVRGYDVRANRQLGRRLYPRSPYYTFLHRLNFHYFEFNYFHRMKREVGRYGLEHFFEVVFIQQLLCYGLDSNDV